MTNIHIYVIELHRLSEKIKQIKYSLSVCPLHKTSTLLNTYNELLALRDLLKKVYTNHKQLEIMKLYLLSGKMT